MCSPSAGKGRDARQGFDQMLSAAVRREFDVIATWAVDRLGRSLPDLISTLQVIRATGVDLFVHQQSLGREHRHGSGVASGTCERGHARRLAHLDITSTNTEARPSWRAFIVRAHAKLTRSPRLSSDRNNVITLYGHRAPSARPSIIPSALVLDSIVPFRIALAAPYVIAHARSRRGYPRSLHGCCRDFVRWGPRGHRPLGGWSGLTR